MIQRFATGVVALTLCAATSALVSGNAHADCMDDAAAYHQLSALLLRTIARHESGMRANAVNRNTNGTEDIGLMQINSVHLPRLARYGITRAKLFEPCVSAYVGAWILRDCLDRVGATWAGVGCYNAGAHDKRMRYANRIYQTLLSTQPK
ncbi:Soluble lytic murein transglycosylase (plasmid) [Cupriavidus necator H850]|jgi:soluble lytic murein transglycosylase-like protein|uniref:lytic transglycosylase domain-containing protein n=1 Tax=Cupriavidus TaxID=106589 RepID=UPI00129D32E7|nr:MULTISPECIES: lytic transglycosylase domain-containing protein [Cupriavidus]KAI3611800.1 Soluble lytic murein transglycosylase [Cupriavidus necator H850]QUN31798.1 lytic transglycosylase domain-containing protein [Cupriavidus sp. KK10]